MRLYRIAPHAFLENYQGLGASYMDGARWNLPGIPILYFASSASVAMLEMANYLPSSRLAPSYRLGIYELAKRVGSDSMGVDDLPADWNRYPYPASTQRLGSKWLQAVENALLIVPSAAVPAGLESILVVNPLHPDSKTLQLISSESQIYSERAFRRVDPGD